jgi:hypothetical protein
MEYEGVIIEESLENKDILKDLRIISTKVKPISEDHKTPWLKKWTLHTINVPANDADKVAEIISKSLDGKHWYADYKNTRTHYIIYPNKVFKIDRTKVEEYKAATKFGLALGIPDNQLDFAPNVVKWERPTDS